MNEQTGFNPKRRLCPDGNCTGVVGADGRCGECGRFAGEASASSAPGFGELADLADSAELPPFDAEPFAATADEPAPGVAVLAGAGSSAFDPGRRLCEDGTCVGVIGSSGVCTVCGRPAGGP